MSLIFYFFNIFIQYLIIIFTLKISYFFPFSFIFGSYKTYLTFSSSIYPVSLFVFPIPSIIIFLKRLLFSSFLNFKIAIPLSSIFFCFLNLQFNLKNKVSISFLFLVFYLILCFLNPEIYWYGFGWLFSLLIINYSNIFLKSFATVWFAHAIGTIDFILKNPNFKKEFYQGIILISWVERIILALGLLIVYYSFIFLRLKIDKFVFYLEKVFKKKFNSQGKLNHGESK